MQISPTIMRLAVILSVSLQIYANTVVVPPAAWVTASRTAPPPGVGSPASPATSPVRLLLPARPSTASRSERNVYRTKLSKLRLILLADMLNEIPPAPQELITCLANSSTLNVTTKHCDCETYSCKDLLASSSPSPLNYIQPKSRKVHSSCREHCCRKKKFNRSIDPATLGNVLVTSDGEGRRRNGGPEASLIHPAAGRLVQLSSRTGVVSGGEPSRRGVTVSIGGGPPSPRDRLAAYCNRDAIAQISISNGDQRTIIPWLYRVGLIETRHPVCVGALIHPSVILTTAVCVINKKPEELYVWNGAADGSADQQAVGRIMLPDQFATTFERLENNVALLVLVRGTKQDKHVGSPSGVREPPPEVEPSASEWRRRNRWHEGAEPIPGTVRRKRTPAAVPICLSSIIEPTTQDRRAHRASGRCFTVAHRRTDRLERSTLLRHQPKTPDTSVATDGTNYVTTNISIFPATECRPEHGDYLQHDGNLCAGYGAASNRSIDVDYSGAPLICDEDNGGRTWRTVRGLLTWSTDINHAPHLFTNLTTYRPWIERSIEQLELPPQRSSGRPPIAVQTTRPRTYRPGVVLYG
ncbi:uncharacterized protein LOC128275791 [Anopheles cruzii]|uniref:uncharacterized protein LOC128275791 n=1 Tax=Anopheles cruzii TaxID=68878 RepID=UPI0022EC403F|nr:uncharacterized protein LOC128275791 [Anopheles cruzii]